ncbi:hypothetical protein N9L68_05175 [bacterium]|nr:hypothetical protein [bacterium]
MARMDGRRPCCSDIIDGGPRGTWAAPVTLRVESRNWDALASYLSSTSATHRSSSREESRIGTWALRGAPTPSSGATFRSSAAGNVV